MKSILTILLISFNVISVSLPAQAWKDYTDSAIIHRRENTGNESVTWYLKANALLERDSANQLAYIENAKAIGDIYYSKAQYKEASVYYLQARSTCEKLNGRTGRYITITDS